MCVNAKGMRFCWLSVHMRQYCVVGAAACIVFVFNQINPCELKKDEGTESRGAALVDSLRLGRWSNSHESGDPRRGMRV